MSGAALIERRDKIAFLYNIQPHKYLGGSSMKPIKKAEDFRKTGLDKPSLFVAVVPIGFKPDAMVDLSGRAFMSGEFGIRGDNDQHYDYPTSDYYKFLYDFSGLFSDMGHCNYGIFDGEQFNPICLKADQIEYDINGNEHYSKGVSAREKGLGPGCASVWNGNSAFFPKADLSIIA